MAINKNFNINANLITQGDLSVQGNLNVQGTTTTVNQETLTIKDNIIAVNADGTSISTQGKAGIVIVDGGEGYKIKGGTNPETGSVYQYIIYGGVIGLILSITYDYDYDNGGYVLDYNENTLNEIVRALNKLVVGSSCDGWYQSDYGYEDTHRCDNVTKIVVYQSGAELSLMTDGSDPVCLYGFSYGESRTYNTSVYLQSENNYISKNEVDILSSGYHLNLAIVCNHPDGNPFTITNSCSPKAVGTAYAAPIYDLSSDSLKIGLGTYTKDDKGNIDSFTFANDNQAQSILTRDSSLTGNKLMVYDSINHTVGGSNTIDVYSNALYLYNESEPSRIYSETKCDSYGVVNTVTSTPVKKRGITRYSTNSIIHRNDWDKETREFYLPTDEVVPNNSSNSTYKYTLATKEWIYKNVGQVSTKVTFNGYPSPGSGLYCIVEGEITDGQGLVEALKNSGYTAAQGNKLTLRYTDGSSSLWSIQVTEMNLVSYYYNGEKDVVEDVPTNLECELTGTFNFVTRDEMPQASTKITFTCSDSSDGMSYKGEYKISIPNVNIKNYAEFVEWMNQNNYIYDHYPEQKLVVEKVGDTSGKIFHILTHPMFDNYQTIVLASGTLTETSLISNFTFKYSYGDDDGNSINFATNDDILSLFPQL